MVENWHDISIFLAVARGGSTNAAAKTMGVNPTTVSRRIASLERDLGLVLFERDTQGYRITTDGQALLAEAEQVELKMLVLNKKAAALVRAGTGTLRVTAPESVFDPIVNEIIADFRKIHPNLRFEYLSGDDKLDLEAGEADIAFRGTEELEGDNLICRRLHHHKWSVFASPTWKRMPRGPEELRDYPVAVYTGPMHNLKPHGWYLEHVDEANIVAECNSLANMAVVVQQGAALGLLSYDYAQRETKCVPCFPATQDTVSGFWLVTCQRAYRRSITREFMEFSALRYNARLEEIQGPQPSV